MTSSRETVLEALKTALLAIDGTGSYHHDVGTRVFRWESEAVAQAAKPAVLLRWVSDVELAEESSGATHVVLRRLTVAIDGLLADDVTASDSAEEQGEQLVEDIERAIMADRRLGLSSIIAQVAQFEDSAPVPASDGQPFIGGRVTLGISYQQVFS